MPTKTKLTTREQVKGQVDYTASPPKLNVSAKPVDPYVDSAGGGASDLLQALSVLNDKVVPAAGKIGTEYGEVKKKEGAQSAQLGGVPPAPSKGAAFTAGYMAVKGQQKSVEFDKEMATLFATKSHLAPDQWDAAVAVIHDKYRAGITDGNMMDGFLEDFTKTDVKWQGEYQKRKNLELVAQSREAAGAVLDQKAADAADQAAAAIGIPLTEGAQSFATNLDNRAKLDENRDAFRADLAPRLRAILDEARVKYESMGMTQREISAAMLQIAGKMAGNYGMPEILDYAEIRDPQNGNIAVRDAFPELYEKYSDQARTMGETISSAMVKRAAAAKLAAMNTKNGNRYTKLASMTNVDEAIKMLNDVSDDQEMDAETKYVMSKHLYSVIRGQGFAQVDDQRVSRQLELDINSGRLVGNDARKQLVSSAKELSAETFRYLDGRIVTIEDGLKSEAKGHLFSAYTRTVNDSEQGIKDRIAPPDKLTGFIDPDRIKVRDTALGWFQRGLSELRQKFGSEENIPGTEIWKLQDSVIKGHLPHVEALVGKEGTTGKAMPSASWTDRPMGGVTTAPAAPGAEPRPELTDPSAPPPASVVAAKAAAVATAEEAPKPKKVDTSTPATPIGDTLGTNPPPGGYEFENRFMTGDELLKYLSTPGAADALSKKLANIFTKTGAAK